LNMEINNVFFGILNIKTNNSVNSDRKRKQHIVFDVDCSGSMSDICNDNRSKMDHINHTIINMIMFIVEHPELMVFISVFAFDDQIYTIIENELISKENIETLVQQVRQIRPKNMTNIEKALINSKDYIQKMYGCDDCDDCDNCNDFNKDKSEEYINTIHSKNNHLIEKFNNILKNQEPKLFCIKCLAGEYSIENIIDLNNSLLKYSPQNYLAIICEEDKNINLDNLNLINTCIIVSPKLTGHNEAILSEKYNTEIYYKQLFEKAKMMMNI